MKNNFTYENTKDATHVYFGLNGIQFGSKSGYINSNIDCMNNRSYTLSDEYDVSGYDIDLTDQTGRGYPTLEWFLGCGFKLEAGDEWVSPSGAVVPVDEINMHSININRSDNGRRYVKSLHDNRYDLTAMARDGYYSKRGKQWPDNSRIDAIGQNGNNGEHYPHESESPLSPNFESKPVYTQEMCDNGELPPVGSECLCTFDSGEWNGKVVKVYSHDVNSNDNVVLAGAEISSGGVTAVEFHERFLKPIDTRTDEEKLRYELISELSSSYTRVTDIVKNKSRFAHYANDLIESGKFTITLNEES